jgi:hypothetical protein
MPPAENDHSHSLYHKIFEQPARFVPRSSDLDSELPEDGYVSETDSDHSADFSEFDSVRSESPPIDSDFLDPRYYYWYKHFNREFGLASDSDSDSESGSLLDYPDLPDGEELPIYEDSDEDSDSLDFEYMYWWNHFRQRLLVESETDSEFSEHSEHSDYHSASELLDSEVGSESD